ncbi:conserved Plasmodium protein, unknown function [Plasmodium berghei]|uniref:Uncharacterized protein n=2 Tax=Plasmodium berghei TaxID=5821 RepID=A0A509AC82_PLABA|nr:conserved Plasmodium protein, unknown function [Plasmodium berghei ANKA]CXH85643.1 conserved Plasmodium protein, unknown function [Plasmodium berghei]SCL89880.1 conserved Plasmodium protein, unknown function [Plasmodium berghei]SCM15172.1 conserved Plasmodium protein, unknown function [Plasmodium berghei]SCM16967.1 conserved Plasmodium protein, unknown function [Plasmodium berghei]SCN21778.1 conserved Plasmodium protein, unknown function [Plasmodium berghei]|eukprot:XP_034419748.1 conserved Plasmodium protein, unknown function [Plasmodium berghei ANKA]
MYEQIKLLDVQELKLLLIEEYNEYIKLVKTVELYHQKMQLNWFKFHLFYEHAENNIPKYYSTNRKTKNQVNKKTNNMNNNLCNISDGPITICKGKKKKKLSGGYSNYKSIEEDLKFIHKREKNNECYYFKAYNNDKPHSLILHFLRDIPNSVELYINIKIKNLNKLKNGVLMQLNNFCKIQINKIYFLIILCEIKLNNSHLCQKMETHNKSIIHKNIKNIVIFCKKIIHEVTKNMIPFFFLFNLFSTPDYFKYHFEYFNNLIRMLDV